MNIMNGSLKGRVYEGLEEKVELASASAGGTAYRIVFISEPERDLYKLTSAEGKYAEVNRT